MSEFDKLRRSLAATLHKGDCNKARVLAAKLLVRARTPSERSDVHRAQQRVAKCTIGLGAAKTRRRKTKTKRKSR